ncbi:hypothetical protein H5410_021634 [Solanum commersonii]|uniref:Integrase core domain containing protein n=1 Tax=Solanum commersonii TaxID=4109 RepID=A0A9J5ZBW3_SOLCO|nr:hypothetical protein H5410_021634 [Solanum commersonii]
MLRGSNLPMLRGPMLNQPQGPARMNKQPRLMRPLAQSQYQHQGMRILLQWSASQTDAFTSVTRWLENILRELYASYVATLRGSISKRSNPIAQDPLTSTMVRGYPMYISHATISRLLYGPTTGHCWSLNTADFDYRWDIIRSGAFQRNAEQRKTVILWLAKYIAADGERAEWVATPWLGIRKATLNFEAKFF